MSVAVAPQLPARRRGRPPIAGLRDDILRAAEAVFTRHEYHQVQMDQVAEACGVGKGTLYRYFPSKRALYLAVVFEGIARLRVELEAALAAADAPARRIELIVRRTLAYFWDRRFFFALIHRHEPQRDGDAREWLRQREQLALLVAQTVEKAIAVGQVRRVDARIAAEMLLGMIRGANRYRMRGDRLEDLVGFIVGVFMRGVGTPAGLHVLAGDRRRRKR
jgi:AcrR family transcriptional regulator